MHASVVMDNVRIARVARIMNDNFQIHFVDTDTGHSSHVRVEMTREQLLDLWLKMAQRLGIDVTEGEENRGTDHHEIGPNL